MSICISILKVEKVIPEIYLDQEGLSALWNSMFLVNIIDINCIMLKLLQIIFNFCLCNNFNFGNEDPNSTFRMKLTQYSDKSIINENVKFNLHKCNYSQSLSYIIK